MQRLVLILLTLVSLGLLSCNQNQRFAYIRNNDISFQEDDTIGVYTPNHIEYKIQPYDRLDIRIVTINNEVNEYFRNYNGEGNINRTNANNQGRMMIGYLVNDSGYVVLPLLGAIEVHEKTISEAEEVIQNEADNYLRESRVIVRLLNYRITFLGEIGREGVLEVNSDKINILDALAQMGGLTEYAKRESILIVRYQNNKYNTYRVDVTDRALLESEKYFLIPNDMVIIEPIRSKKFRVGISDYSFFLSTISAIITSVTLIFTVFGNSGNSNG